MTPFKPGQRVRIYDFDRTNGMLCRDEGTVQKAVSGYAVYVKADNWGNNLAHGILFHPRQLRKLKVKKKFKVLWMPEFCLGKEKIDVVWESPNNRRWIEFREVRKK